MAVYTSPTNVISGTNLTASLWNDQLGSAGSLVYLYDTLNTTISNALSRNLILRKSTNTTLAAAGNSDITFDTIVTNFANDQLNFPLTVPSAYAAGVTFPTAGMYLATFSMRYTVASTITVRFQVNGSTTVIAQQNQLAYAANGNVISTAILTSESATAYVVVNVTSTAAGTITAAAPTGTVDGGMMLKLVKLNVG